MSEYSEHHDLHVQRSADRPLYSRDPTYIPRVAAVHDLCGYGKCSLTAAIPILSAAGCDVCPVPTSLFSSHTLFPHFVSLDTTDFISGYMDAWKKIGVHLDAIYSGFLGSAQQVSLIERLYREYPHALRFVDPVMGDDGKMYPTYTQDLCTATKKLVPGADVLMPNLTEASLLTGIQYRGQDVTPAFVTTLLAALLAQGAHAVVLKGIDHGDGFLRNYVATDSQLPDLKAGKPVMSELRHAKLAHMIHGTGDAFASALCAGIMAGKTLEEAARIAGEFVRDAMISTLDQPDYSRRGVSFELVLNRMTALIPREE